MGRNLSAFCSFLLGHEIRGSRGPRLRLRVQALEREDFHLFSAFLDIVSLFPCLVVYALADCRRLFESRRFILEDDAGSRLTLSTDTPAYSDISRERLIQEQRPVPSIEGSRVPSQ